ncbi:MAG TPA: NAD(P)/FAD-dependent oxidoreductase, partial [Bacteroidales bacterium]|nr:NAD(P)/FAD-dependent oxidoreductase [Bacteroidales bacterium]
MNDADITIIGAGVVGLAIAEKISGSYKNVFVIEKHNSFGQETSSRNSEVIHAGIYYPQDSLKAKLCVAGKVLLYEYCEKYDIPFKRCGKLIVATSEEEIPVIEGVRETALRNGVDDLIVIDRDEIAEMEPAIFALKALYSPSTGIIDSHSLMKQYETNTLNNGGQIVYGSEVIAIRRIDKGYEITLNDADGMIYNFSSAIVINSAGLESDIVAGMAGIKDKSLKIMFCKGEYFRINPPKNRLLNKLIYPVPHPKLEHIGVHVTVDIAGGVKLGPDVKYLESNVYDYRLTPSKQEAFFLAAKKFLPFLEFDDIAPEMAGIRPKLQKPGEQIRDYYIMEESGRGYPGFINLIDMESPALTSSIAIAGYVYNMVER